jgi:glycosyltransferase involved in cell wall biosynthesis
MDPKVTVIVSVSHTRDLLSHTIKSVLSQKFFDMEVLLLESALVDSTRAAITPFLSDNRVRHIIQQQNSSSTSNRNYGLSIAKGKYVAMIDCGDMWLDECKLGRQVELLETHPDIGIVGTFAKKVDDAGVAVGEIVTHAADRSIRRNMMRRNQFVQSSVLIRKEALDDIGWYDENIPIWEDYELWLRVGKLYQFRNIPEQLTGYRDHVGNISKESEEKSIRAYQMIYKLHKKSYPYAWLLLLKIIIKKAQLHFKHLS